MNPRELIRALRGKLDGDLVECCGCGNSFPVEAMLPEEAGDWVCRPCWDRWQFFDAFAEMFPTEVREQ